VAPNILTLAALGFSFAACCLYLPFDGTMQQEFPAWTYYFSVFALLMYQTLDAVDGKQARRTGSSSPLGQLFDHGCDAINTNFFGFLTYQSYQLGASWHTLIIFGTSTVSQHTAPRKVA
jgi:phosphatidylglycerophosphate synthase